jgi:hypothetical protein
MGAVVWALTTLPLIASAAEVTRVASSFDDNHPFGLYVDAAYERWQHNGIIVQEQHANGDRVDSPQLNYLGVDSRLELDLHVGIWRGLEFSFGLPIILSQTDAYTYANGVSATNSSLTQNCITASGELVDPNCPSTGVGTQPIGTVPSTNYRSGLGNLRFGLTYAIFRQSLDSSKPTWTIFFKYEAPTAPLRDPAALTSPTDHQAVGDRVHRYLFGTAFSRRLGVAEPYFKLDYTLPYRGPGYYSNCDRTDLGNLGAPENCTSGYWSRAETGINAPHVFRLITGTEIVPVDNAKGQKVVVDVRALATYYTGGRYYNEITPLFQKLMSSEGYLEVGGSLGITAQPASFITFRLRGTYSYQTDRTLSSEPLGKDIDGDGRVSYQGHPSPEVNPTFDYRADAVGRRFRIVSNGVFSVNVQMSLNF